MKPLRELTAREAMELIEREARNAGVPPRSSSATREVLIAALESNPKTILPFIASAREHVAEQLARRRR